MPQYLNLFIIHKTANLHRNFLSNNFKGHSKLLNFKVQNTSQIIGGWVILKHFEINSNRLFNGKKVSTNKSMCKSTSIEYLYAYRFLIINLELCIVS